MSYDHLEEARKARASVLAGHVKPPRTTRARTPTYDPYQLARRIDELERRQPAYRADGSGQMLREWLDRGQYHRVRWWLDHA